MDLSYDPEGTPATEETDSADGRAFEELMAHGLSLIARTGAISREAYLVLRARRAGLAREARLAGRFICASRAGRARLAWLAYDLRGTNDEIRKSRLGQIIHDDALNLFYPPQAAIIVLIPGAALNPHYS